MHKNQRADGMSAQCGKLLHSNMVLNSLFICVSPVAEGPHPCYRRAKRVHILRMTCESCQRCHCTPIWLSIQPLQSSGVSFSKQAWQVQAGHAGSLKGASRLAHAAADFNSLLCGKHVGRCEPLWSLPPTEGLHAILQAACTACSSKAKPSSLHKQEQEQHHCFLCRC